jgi:hypothetical protein
VNFRLKSDLVDFLKFDVNKSIMIRNVRYFIINARCPINTDNVGPFELETLKSGK